ncbi:DNA polymerase Y family protein [Candidatus Palauibacter polyketidifaciens]|uniref:DNA polymerase Y family protein n=1 Tax=Candidatus Palauibacter polyketidifaciens TaxID=3056740 RepID=UPI00239D2844|nr:DNA polymerase Y family protein [Candidatus Palauibacter polyketidifaciens]MDE2719433.1 DNA polymerase Y family protein [Candidatus Palauibacter polyketidifaciens]
MDAGRGSRMALCLWWPGFELELERVRTPSLADPPLALPTVGDRRRIEMGCALAASFGVEPGMIVSQAIALCPSLVLCEPDPDFHDAARDRIAEVFRDWSPVVEQSVDRGRFFVGVDGLERLYGPPERQIAGLRARLEALSPWLAASARIGCAPGKFAAWVAARSAESARSTGSAGSGRPGAAVCVAPADLAAFLAPQPVDVLPVSPRMVERLKRLGVERLAGIVRMPEPALVSQFGADGRRALAWARGTRIDRVRPEAPARPIRVALDFPSPIGQLELLHAALDRLIGRALAHPRRRGKSVRGLRVSASLEDGGSWSIRAIAREPTSEPERLGAFLRSRIALDRPCRAVETLRLELFRFGPASAQTGLFDPKEGAARVLGSLETKDGELLPAFRRAARVLRLRLGAAALYRVLELEPNSRLPERRHALMEIA